MNAASDNTTSPYAFMQSIDLTRPWLDSLACAADVLSQWNRQMLDPHTGPTAYAQLGWETLAVLTPWRIMPWLAQPLGQHGHLPSPTRLQPGLSPIDDELDQWHAHLDRWLQQIRRSVDDCIAAGFVAVKFMAGSLATAAPCDSLDPGDATAKPASVKLDEGTETTHGIKQRPAASISTSTNSRERPRRRASAPPPPTGRPSA